VVGISCSTAFRGGLEFGGKRLVVRMDLPSRLEGFIERDTGSLKRTLPFFISEYKCKGRI
jgi:hypothetical protein